MSIRPLSRYLGADVRKVTRPGARSPDPETTGREYWAFSANTYVKNARQTVGT